MDTIIPLPTITSPGKGLLRTLLARSTRVILEPARFFREDLPRLSFSEALAFGIGNAWIAAMLAFFVETLNGFLLVQLLDHWMQQLLVSEEGFTTFGLSGESFLYSAALLLLAPFLYLVRIFFSSVGLFLFARLLIEEHESAPEPVTFSGVMRIQSAALSSEWFSLVPLFGGLLSFLVALVLTVTGVRERFGVSTRRSLAVVIAPYFLLLVAALFFALLVLVALFQFPLQELLDMDQSL